VLNESQLAALEKAKADKEAHGEFEEGVGNFVFVSHTMKPVRAGGRYGGEQGRRNRG
jgi:hypothetical protein